MPWLCWSLEENIQVIYDSALRESLKENNETIPNQVGRSISNPTLKWIFQTMRDVAIVKIKTGSVFKEVVSNLKYYHRIVLAGISDNACHVYGYA